MVYQYTRLDAGIHKFKRKCSCFYLWLLLTIFGASTYLILIRYTFETKNASVLTTSWLTSENSINTPACYIPETNIFDESLKEIYEKYPQKTTCNSGKPALIGSNNTSIFLIKESLLAYRLNTTMDVQCCYQEFWRIEPEPGEPDERLSYGKECISFTDAVNIRSQEFVRVTCKNNANLPIYYDYFAFVPMKQNLLPINQTAKSGNSKLSVLVIGIHSFSRANLHRRMPKTARYLNEIGGFPLLGYNKISKTTFGNIIAVLSGMSENEAFHNCLPTEKDYFDYCYFLWQNYKKKGYVTAFGEDAARMGIFNYFKNGFKGKQPTDYYYDYFSVEAERKIGNRRNKAGKYECVGPREVYQDFLDYVWKFASRMNVENLPYFAFFMESSWAHDNFNRPNFGDEFYYNFFKNMKEAGYLENTAVFFISDRGTQYGDVRETYRGLEDKLPFVISVLPNSFKKKYEFAYTNIQRNARKLTTPFDLHETLEDLSNPTELIERKIKQRPIFFSRGYSLFTEISDERTCSDASIDDKWCYCHEFQFIPLNDTIAQTYAQYAVQVINYDIYYQLGDYKQCAKLRLDAVLNAQLTSHGDLIINGTGKYQDMKVTFSTVPGGGVFDVIIRRNEVVLRRTEKDVFYTKVTFEVIGTISRINFCGNKCGCIKDAFLKQYCYCKILMSL